MGHYEVNIFNQKERLVAWFKGTVYKKRRNMEVSQRSGYVVIMAGGWVLDYSLPVPMKNPNNFWTFWGRQITA